MPELTCPSCNAVLRFGVDPAGRTVRCKGCGHRFVAPALTPTPAAEPPGPEESVAPDTQEPSPKQSPPRRTGIARPFPPSRATAQGTQQFQEKAKAGVQDAWTASKRLILNPVGGIGEAYESLGNDRAFVVGIVFAVLFDLCVLFAAYKAFSAMGAFDSRGGFDDLPHAARGHHTSNESAAPLVKFALVAAVPLVSIALATLVFRKVVGAAGSFKGDVFVAGASLLPLGLGTVLVSLIGLQNFQVVIGIGVFSLCIVVLVLYAGLTKVAKIPEHVASWGVPATVIIAAWILKELAISIITA